MYSKTYLNFEFFFKTYVTLNPTQSSFGMAYIAEEICHPLKRIKFQAERVAPGKARKHMRAHRTDKRFLPRHRERDAG